MVTLFDSDSGEALTPRTPPRTPRTPRTPGGTPNNVVVLAQGSAAEATCSREALRGPERVKLRKRLGVWPLSVKVGADVDWRARNVNLVCSAKERILGGRLGLEGTDVTYERGFAVPDNSRLVLSGRCCVDSRSMNYGRVSIGIKVQPYREASATLAQPGSFDVRHKVALSKRVKAEFCGHVVLPLPAAQFDFRPGFEEEATVALGAGRLRVHLHQTNLIVYL